MAEHETRSVRQQIELAAPLEAVWNALTKADELTRWFPTEARVEPGAGGSIWVSWGAPWEMESDITVWEPNRHLRLESEPRGGHQLAIDYHLEGRSGTTILRLVHSGFGNGEEWDDEYDGVTGGWTFFLWALKHYLERHPGEPRHVTSARAEPQPGPEPLWQRLDALGFEPALAHLEPGTRYRVDTPLGPMTGEVGVLLPPTHFGGTLNELGDGHLFIELEPHGGGHYAPCLWVSAFGGPDRQRAVGSLQPQLNHWFTRVFD